MLYNLTDEAPQLTAVSSSWFHLYKGEVLGFGVEDCLVFGVVTFLGFILVTIMISACN